MKRILATCVLAASIGLAGCSTTATNGGSVTAPDVLAIITQVQSYTKVACGFVPTAATIINIIGSAVPGVAVATSIAEAVCTAIAPPPMAAGKKSFVAKSVKGFTVTPGAVNGVIVHGDRTQ
jgi:hypothetical protein